MPNAAKRPCAVPGCAALVARGVRYCSAHKRAQKPGGFQAGRSSAALGYGAAWQRLRRWVLATEPLCRNCARHGRVTAAQHVDHIVPKTQGGTDDRSNLQPLCMSCHSAKTNRERVLYGASGGGASNSAQGNR